jgi:ferritin-like metal-binding protein YciE
MQELKDREELIYREVQVLHNAASILVNALPRMIMTSADLEVKSALIQQLEETEVQIERLEKVAKYFEIQTEGQRSTGLRALISESEELISSGQTNDTAILSTAHKIADYQIAGYGTAAELAEELGFEFVRELLQQSLEEIKTTNELFVALDGKPLNQETSLTETSWYLSQF